MSTLKRITLIPKAARQLGGAALWRYAVYEARLHSGWLRLQTPPRSGAGGAGDFGLRRVLRPAGRSRIEKALGKQAKELYAEADQILAGKVRLFGAALRKLQLKPPGKLHHWTHYVSHLPDGSDIRPVWEAGRFSWGTILARANWLSGEEKYAEAFWLYFENFTKENPANLGPHWSSAQEVAMRIIAWAFCYSLLADAPSSTAARREALAHSVAQHAERIPPTLGYARAQNNNHLLSEAMGLVTAAGLLPAHPKAEEWRVLGRKTFAEGLEKQVHADGAYAQHSSNYQRLVLQLGTWAVAIGEPLSKKSRYKLAKAEQWLGRLLDDDGRVPNLGPNDGAYILPLCVSPFADFRPALQAARAAFGGGTSLTKGAWDEAALWQGISPARTHKAAAVKHPLKLEGAHSWAYLRAANFQERPGHADQLHLDLWWRGLNVARDAGSYLYNAPPPWDNALSATRVHNTITVEDRNQMQRGGRFLWLDWAQAKVVKTEVNAGRLVYAQAEHDGYRKLGLTHRREVRVERDRWLISDQLASSEEPQQVSATLHWLLPDWNWELNQSTLKLKSPHGFVKLEIAAKDVQLSLFRAGKRVYGNGEADPILGWASPTYGVKRPALALLAKFSGVPPLFATSTWMLPK